MFAALVLSLSQRDERRGAVLETEDQAAKDLAESREAIGILAHEAEDVAHRLALTDGGLFGGEEETRCKWNPRPGSAQHPIRLRDFIQV